jgi:F-type H+-transporting ATPase subunit gamma
MGNNLRDIRRKMKGFKSTRQVTKAMELVSASKMRRAVQNAQILRRYAITAWTILRKLAHAHPGQHLFLEQRPVRNVLLIVLASDRGLCGSFNSHIVKTASQYVRGIQGLGSGVEVEYIAVGRRAQQALARSDAKIIAAFPALSNHPKFRDILPISRMAIEAFQNRTYDHVVLVYSTFLSALTQEPTVKVLLPFSATELKKVADEVLGEQHLTKEEQHALQTPLSKTEYIFEPSPAEVLDRILPQLTELQIFQAVLETAASEHSARMIAMRNASDNASDVIDDLTLTYNRTRQAGITAELAELSASKAALD